MADSGFEKCREASRHGECALCLEPFKSPRILPCFHSFCLSCLKQLTLNLQPSGSFPCPSCRSATQMPAGGVESFQVNFYIEAEMERTRQAKRRAAPHCDICGKASAKHKCLDCNQLACDSCTRVHASFAATRAHTVLNLEQSDRSDTELLHRDRFCQVHSGEKLRFYCCQCARVICRDCKLTSHDGHTCTDIVQKGASAKRVIGEVATKSRQSLEPKLKQVLGWAQEHKDRLLLKKEDIRETLRKRADDIKREVDECVTATEQHLDSEADVVFRVIQNMEDKFRAFLSLCEHAERVTKTGNDVDAVEFFAQLGDFWGVSQGRFRGGSQAVPVTTVAGFSFPNYQQTQAGFAFSFTAPSQFHQRQQQEEEPSKLSEFSTENWRQNLELTGPQNPVPATTSGFTLGGGLDFGGGGGGLFRPQPQQPASYQQTNLTKEITGRLGAVRRRTLQEQFPKEGVIIQPAPGLQFEKHPQSLSKNSDNVHCQIAKDLADIRDLFSRD